MLKEKNIVITGSNRGIGKATVKVVAEQGANIFACARKPSDEFEAWCRELALQNQVNIYPIYFDFANAEEMRKAFQEIKGITKNVDALVNVAGTVHNANFQMTKQEQLQNLMQINFFSQVQFTQYILKLMTKQRKGSIINIASSGGIDGNAGRTAYNASKAAVISWTKTMARELGGIGIRVNAIAPGLIDTDMARDNTPEDVLDREIKGTSLLRMGQAEEIANVIAFLCSDLSSYVTGQTWRVDGGM